ncbi:MAG: methyl-accepting chemotaxis protein [Oscillospiraceae bacterium]
MKQKQNTKDLDRFISDKGLLFNLIFLDAICLIFGAINLFTNVAIGVVTIGFGAVTSALFFIMKAKRVSKSALGMLISIMQLGAILLIGIFKHELNIMFPLILTAVILSSLYYNIKSLIVQWSVTNIFILAGFIFNDFFYGGATVDSLIKGVIAVNASIYIVIFITKNSLKRIFEAENLHAESNKLLEQVNEQAESSGKLVEEQTKLVEQVAKTAGILSGSAERMSGLSVSMSSAAEEQERTINDIGENINAITVEANKALEESGKAAEAAQKSSELVTENDAEVRKMTAAMQEITDASHQIESIIATIEDIAFQTNILALNAAIEAARAGSAGKGFAVVADEVRNLATKSAEAAKDTSDLIKSTIESVNRGTELVGSVADRMSGIIASCEESSEHSKLIESLVENQNNSVRTVREMIQQISKAVEQNAETAVSCAEAAGAVSDEVRALNELVGTK